MSERTYTAVLDRFEEETAVLLLEADDETVDELAVPKGLLPSEGRHRDAIFTVSVAGPDRTEFVYEPDETRKRSDDAQSRFDRLSRSLSPDDERS